MTTLSELITAQDLYDFRAEFEFCSGKELAAFFEAVTGTPSPKGAVEIKRDLAEDFVSDCINALYHNGVDTEDIAAAAKELFPDEELAPLTIVLGYNSVGKSDVVANLVARYIRVIHLPPVRQPESPSGEGAMAWLNHLIPNADPRSFGAGQLLALFEAVLSAEDDSIVVIEQPETGLHPRIQAELADFFISQTKRGVRFVLETHSEHILLRMRRRIAETTVGVLENPHTAMKADDLSVYFVYREGDAEEIKIDALGEQINIPQGFKEFWGQGFKDLVKMKSARRAMKE